MKKLIIIVTLFLATGCNYIANKSGYEKVESAKAKVEKVQQEAAVALNKKEEEVKTKLFSVIDKQNSQMQAAANSIWAAGDAFRFYEKPTRLDLIIRNRVGEAQSALGLAPTLESIEKERVRLAKELDETKTSLAELQAAHEQKVQENNKLVQDTAEEKAKVAALIAEKEKMEKEFDEKIKAEQSNVIVEQGKVIVAQNIAGEKTKYIEANKRYMMIALGVISIAALIIAIYLPLYKKESFTLAGITGGLAICILFVQPFHFAIIFALGIILGLLVLARKIGIGNKTNENLVNAVQEFKENDPEKYKALKPILEEYNKKYEGDGKVEDKAVTGHINEILKDYERK